MSIVDDLSRRARANPPPSELTINDSQVTPLAEHLRALMMKPWDTDAEDLEQSIRRGSMKFMAIPVRVLGTDGETTQ